MNISEFEIWYHTRYHRTSSALTSTMLILSDLMGAMLSFGTGFFLVNLYNIDAINFKSFVTYAPYLPVFIIIFQMFHLYPGVSMAPAEELRSFTLGSLIAHGAIILSRYIEDDEFGAISAAFIISFIVSPLIFLICRSFTHTLLRKSSLGGIPAVVFGGGSNGKLIVDRLKKKNKMGYEPVLILDDDVSTGDYYYAVPIIHDTGLGPEIVRRFNIKMAIIAMPNLDHDELVKLLNYSVSAFRYNVIVPDFFDITNIWISIRDFDGILGFASHQSLKMFWNLWVKRFVDLVILLIGGILTLPFLLIIGLLIKISSPGPVLYKHTRLGQKGKKIRVYKFRTMAVDAEERLNALLASNPKLRAEWEVNFKLRDDPRVTKIGKFLRQTSLDEFPQIINVLKGEMSLVGPRPITGDEVKKYGEAYERIFSVKPGLTGLWQVSGRSDTDYNERISYDTYYIQSWSLWLDLWILYKTFGVVLRGKGAY